MPGPQSCYLWSADTGVLNSSRRSEIQGSRGLFVSRRYRRALRSAATVELHM